MRVLALATILITAAVTTAHAIPEGTIGDRYSVVEQVWKYGEQPAQGETFWFNQPQYPSLNMCEMALLTDKLKAKVIDMAMGMSQEWERKVSFHAYCSPLSPSGERPAR